MRRDAHPLPRVDDTLDELNNANYYYTHLDLASCFWQGRREDVRGREMDVHKTAF
jgi:hypothetical protein